MILKRLLLLVAMLSATFLLTAKPAIGPGVMLVQPDGTTVRAVVHGDEFRRLLTDVSGHALIQDSDGWYCYAAYNADGTKYSTGYPAGQNAPGHVLSSSLYVPEAALNLRARALRRPVLEDGRRRALRAYGDGEGTDEGPAARSCIILLAQFADLEMTRTREDFELMASSPGYSGHGATGSILDYFNEQFRGDVSFSFEVGPIVTLDGTQRHYCGNNGDSRDVNVAKAIAETCIKSAEAGVDFSRYDCDGDGAVDNVFVFFAGKDEADGGGEDCVWSHQYRLSYTGDDLILDGKTIDCYAVSTELGGWYDPEQQTIKYDFCGIGSFCHEYSHVLGLMDTYDTDGSGSGGLADGLWVTTGLMDGANRNNRGRTPAHYNAVEYDALGLGNAETLAPGTYVLEPISRNRRYLKAESGVPGEYYLFECRDASGWDSYIGGSGLAVYHVDRSSSPAGRSDYHQMVLTAARRWQVNEINCRPDRQCARMVPAWPDAKAFDDMGYYTGNPSIVFYPYRKNNSLTPVSEPPFVFWSGEACQLAITDITISGVNVSFRVISNAGIVIPEPQIERSDVFQDGAVVQWTSSDPDFGRPAYVVWGESSTSVTDTLEVEPYAAGRYAISFDSLKPRTAYKVSIVFGANGIFGISREASFTTRSVYDRGYPFIYLNSVERNDDGSFPRGAKLPLRIYNAQGAEHIRWTFAGREISVGTDGYFEVTSSGLLQAEIAYEDGGRDYITKTVTVR